MLQKTTANYVWLKSFFIIPLTGILIFLFAERVYSQEKKQFTPPKIVKDEPSPPPYSKKTQNKLNTWPIILEYSGTDAYFNNAYPIKLMKGGKLPDGVKNLVLKEKDGAIVSAIFIYKDGKREIENVAGKENKEAFYKKYNIHLADKIPPPPKIEVKRFTPPKVVKDTPPPPAKPVKPFTPPRVVKDVPPPPPPKKTVKKFTPPIVIKDNGGEGATASEIKEFETIVKKMTVTKNGEANGYRYIDGKTPRAEDIYNKMTPEQRKNTLAFPPSTKN